MTFKTFSKTVVVLDRIFEVFKFQTKVLRMLLSKTTHKYCCVKSTYINVGILHLKQISQHKQIGKSFEIFSDLENIAEEE